VSTLRPPPLRPKRSLGQNFLRDENIARKIVAAIAPQPDQVMVEIGPGEGALTKYLAPFVDRLVAIDIDRRVITKLQETISEPSVTLLCQDVLETDFASLASGGRLRIIGNIPYNITSPILFHVLDNRHYVADAILMMQREVARRLIAHPHTKEYGILSVFCQLFADVALLFDVSPNAFFPRPSVTSSVVRLTILSAPRYPLRDEEFFRAMVRSVFGKRRKTLRNSLSYFLNERGYTLPLSSALQARPEDLTLEQIVELGNALYERISSPPAPTSLA
jgi:16S rRNA (adenine1518-N6/adenine1519-N6)-dimethyltransferase